MLGGFSSEIRRVPTGAPHGAAFDWVLTSANA
jgi:hypothetical protein